MVVLAGLKALFCVRSFPVQVTCMWTLLFIVDIWNVGWKCCELLHFSYGCTRGVWYKRFFSSFIRSAKHQVKDLQQCFELLTPVSMNSGFETAQKAVVYKLQQLVVLQCGPFLITYILFYIIFVFVAKFHNGWLNPVDCFNQVQCIVYAAVGCMHRYLCKLCRAICHN